MMKRQSNPVQHQVSSFYNPHTDMPSNLDFLKPGFPQIFDQANKDRLLKYLLSIPLTLCRNLRLF
jgi:hypothetical protein